MSVGSGDADAWRQEFQCWKDAGVTHVTLNNAFGRCHHQRMAGRTLQDHLSGIERYREAVADLL